MAFRVYVIALSICWVVLHITGVRHWNHSEFGVFEHVQLFLLLLAAIGWLASARKLASIVNALPASTPPSDVLLRGYPPSYHVLCVVFGQFMALSMFFFLCRETSWLRIWGISDVAGMPTKFIGLLLIAAGLALIGRQAMKFKAHLNHLHATATLFMRSKVFAYSALSALWLIVAQISEKQTGWAPHEYYEELCELIAYATLCYASLMLATPTVPHSHQ